MNIREGKKIRLNLIFIYFCVPCLRSANVCTCGRVWTTFLRDIFFFSYLGLVLEGCLFNDFCLLTCLMSHSLFISLLSVKCDVNAILKKAREEKSGRLKEKGEHNVHVCPLTRLGGTSQEPCRALKKSRTKSKHNVPPPPTLDSKKVTREKKNKQSDVSGHVLRTFSFSLTIPCGSYE